MGNNVLILLKHTLVFWVSVASLILLVAITVASCLFLNVKVGLSIGLIAFLLLGGFEAVWYLLTRRMERRIDEGVNREQVSRSYEESRNNPTIR